MASAAQLETALRNADAAGDVEGARVLARALIAARQTPEPDSGIDALRSIPGGLARGVAAFGGIRRDVVDLAQGGVEAVFGKAPAGDPRAEFGTEFLKRAILGPSSAEINATASAPTEGYYEPKTRAGRYAETIAEYAGGALLPGGVAARTARAVIPGAASEAGGELFGNYGRVGGALLGGIATAPGAARAVIRSINAPLARGGAAILNPSAEALRRLRTAAAADNPERIGAAMSERAQTGVPATLLDVTGNNTARLMRAAAAGEGQAQNTAIDYANRIEANIQDAASGHARALTPTNTNTAEQQIAQLERQRGTAASTDYAAPYAAPVQLNTDAIGALRGSHGQAAISRAMEIADANQDLATVADLEKLRTALLAQNAGRFPPTASGRAVDYVRQAMRNMADNANRSLENQNPNLARGLYGRMEGIDSALDAAPGLTDARAAFRDVSQQIEAVPLGQAAIRTPSDDYAARLTGLASRGTPDAVKASAGVGYRSALVDAIERPAERATGTLNQLATATRQTKNLTATFGPQATQRFQTQLSQEIARLEKARYINPNTNSQTYSRAIDQSLVSSIPHSRWAFIGLVIDKLRSGAVTMTTQERAELVRLGTSEAALKEIVSRIPRNVSTPQALATVIVGSRANSAPQMAAGQ